MKKTQRLFPFISRCQIVNNIVIIMTFCPNACLWFSDPRVHV